MSLIKKLFFTCILMIIFFACQINVAKAIMVEITTETLNLRKEASTESDIVAQISQGDECEVLDEEGDWYQVKYGEYTGFISKEYTEILSDGGNDENTTNDENVTPEENSTIETHNNETGNSSNTINNNITIELGEQTIKTDTELKITPLINSSVIENLKAGFKVTAINQINEWVYIYTDESAGWIRAIYLENDLNENVQEKNDVEQASTQEEEEEPKETVEKEKTDASFEEKTMYTNDSYVNIRKEPSTDSEKVMVVELNTELKVIGEDGDWYKVETSQGDAYVSKELLSDKRTPITNRGNISTTKKEAETANVSTSNSTKGEEIIAYAKKFLGVPYVYGGASPSGFDCSGFTMYVFKKFNISMAHGAQSQSKIGKKVSADKNSKTSLLNNLEVGDLVFFLDYETMDEIGHCGIYIGDGKFIHASSGSGYCVKINSLLPGEYYNTRYCAARRVL